MVFSSIMFLFRFLPVTFLIYYIVPRKFKNLVLMVASMIFYAWGEVKYLPIMIASILVDYSCGQGIKRWGQNPKLRKMFLIFSMVFNLGMLLFFKYTNFFLDNIGGIFGTELPRLGLTLPLGISFYTFQTMSYTIDVYRGKVEPEDNIIDFGAFVVLFPQLIAGPIVKYSDVAKELKERVITLDQINLGVRLFIMGVGSKVLIANNVGALWTEVEGMAVADISSPLAWLGALAFSLQIYFDFSGYSLMAIGLGHMLGFKFPQNFNYPYMSSSITEFWRRWHMTLGSWFREYLYFPLGGSRAGRAKTYRNLFIVWAATGFWHGASWNFVLWGLFFFVLLVIEKAWLLPRMEKHKGISRAVVLFLLLLSWMLFAITDMNRLGEYFIRMFSFTGGTDWLYYLRNYGVSLLLGCVLSAPVLKKFYDKWLCRHPWMEAVLLFGIMAVSTAYLVDATYNPFLYFRF